MTGDRVSCCITGCGRTFKREAPAGVAELVICGRHWRMAPLSWRRRCTKFRRMANKLTDPRRALAGTLYNWTWQRCRKHIEEIAAGTADDPALARLLERL